MNHKAQLLIYALRCSSKLQKIKSLETLFQWPSKVQKYQCTQTHTVFVFFFSFGFSLFILKKKKKPTKTNKQHESMKERCKCMKAWFQKQIRNQAKRFLLYEQWPTWYICSTVIARTPFENDESPYITKYWQIKLLPPEHGLPCRHRDKEHETFLNVLDLLGWKGWALWL